MTDEETKKKRSWFRRLVRLLVTLAVLLLLAAGGALGYFHFAPPEQTCLACHEIRPAYGTWTVSTHRNVHCRECHGSALTSGIHGIRQHARELIGHFTRESFEDLSLSEEQVVAMVADCRRCHEEQYAGWQSAGHSVTYTDIFLNEEHNKTEAPFDNCLRCHATFFDGTIVDVVEPLNSEGPWQLVNAEFADRPTMPCQTCHGIHVEGEPLKARTAAADEETTGAGSLEPPHSVGLYNRYERMHFAATDLPPLTIEVDREPIVVSPDPRQRVCVQCHAPESSHEAGTSDDRTPRGVHLGLSCMACHESHSQDARASCATCHPALSNCGLDVETMDTTFRSPESEHNIHLVACDDCHADGVPER